MQTPDNEAGRETEAVMRELTAGKDVPVEIYNRCYEGVYDLLHHLWQAELAKAYKNYEGGA